jgi:hypothetical protein
MSDTRLHLGSSGLDDFLDEVSDARRHVLEIPLKYQNPSALPDAPAWNYFEMLARCWVAQPLKTA